MAHYIIKDTHTRRLRRGIALLTCVIFLQTSLISTPLAQATPVTPPTLSILPLHFDTLQIPEAIGKIDDFYTGSSEQQVIIVQDAHAIPDAQRSIRKAILYFYQKHGVNLIALEGASTQLDARMLKSFPDKDKLNQVLGEYFDNGELAGGTAAAIAGIKAEDNSAAGSKLAFHGVEDWPVYEEALELYLEAMGQEKEVLKKLEVGSSKLEEEKRKQYSLELQKIDATVKAFRENSADFMNTLMLLAEVKAPEKDSELELLLQEAKSEGADQTGAEAEVRRIAEKIKKLEVGSLKLEETKEFNQKYQEFQTGQLSAQAFALFLREFLDANPELLSRFTTHAPRATLSRLSGNAKRMRDLEGTKLFADFELYAQSVKDSLFKTEQEREVDRRDRRLWLLSKLAKLELSYEEWEEFSSWKLDVGSWKIGGERSEDLSGISSPAERGRIKEGDLLPSDRNLRPMLSAHIAFYENALKRDAIFFKNLTGLFKSSNFKLPTSNSAPKAALLIAGGFHARGLCDLLKKNGISYALVMPEIKKLPEQSNYRQHMQGEVSWKNYFEVKGGKVNLYDAFIRGTRDRLLGKVAGVGAIHESPLRDDDKRTSLQDPRLLKNWRDQIIRDLADEGRIEKAGEYTRFIDELTGEGQVQAVQKRLKQVEKFLDGLKRLEAEGQFTAANIAKLLPQATVPDAATAAPLSRSEISVFAIGLRSEVRNVDSGKVAEFHDRYGLDGLGEVPLENGQTGIAELSKPAVYPEFLRRLVTEFSEIKKQLSQSAQESPRLYSIGLGNGIVEDKLQKSLGFIVDGVEASSVQAGRALERGVDVKVGDAWEELPKISDSSRDMVFLGEAIGYFGKNEKHSGLKELFLQAQRILTDGGIIAISTYPVTKSGEYKVSPTGYVDYPISRIVEELQAAGFEVEVSPREILKAEFPNSDIQKYFSRDVIQTIIVARKPAQSVASGQPAAKSEVRLSRLTKILLPGIVAAAIFLSPSNLSFQEKVSTDPSVQNSVAQESVERSFEQLSFAEQEFLEQAAQEIASKAGKARNARLQELFATQNWKQFLKILPDNAPEQHGSGVANEGLIGVNAGTLNWGMSGDVAGREIFIQTLAHEGIHLLHMTFLGERDPGLEEAETRIQTNEIFERPTYYYEKPDGTSVPFGVYIVQDINENVQYEFDAEGQEVLRMFLNTYADQVPQADITLATIAEIERLLPDQTFEFQMKLKDTLRLLKESLKNQTTAKSEVRSKKPPALPGVLPTPKTIKSFIRPEKSLDLVKPPPLPLFMRLRGMIGRFVRSLFRAGLAGPLSGAASQKLPGGIKIRPEKDIARSEVRTNAVAGKSFDGPTEGDQASFNTNVAQGKEILGRTVIQGQGLAIALYELGRDLEGSFSASLRGDQAQTAHKAAVRSRVIREYSEALDEGLLERALAIIDGVEVYAVQSAVTGRNVIVVVPGAELGHLFQNEARGFSAFGVIVLNPAEVNKIKQDGIDAVWAIETHEVAHKDFDADAFYVSEKHRKYVSELYAQLAGRIFENRESLSDLENISDLRDSLILKIDAQLTRFEYSQSYGVLSGEELDDLAYALAGAIELFIRSLQKGENLKASLEKVREALLMGTDLESLRFRIDQRIEATDPQEAESLRARVQEWVGTKLPASDHRKRSQARRAAHTAEKTIELIATAPEDIQRVLIRNLEDLLRKTKESSQATTILAAAPTAFLKAVEGRVEYDKSTGEILFSNGLLNSVGLELFTQLETLKGFQYQITPHNYPDVIQGLASLTPVINIDHVRILAEALQGRQTSLQRFWERALRFVGLSRQSGPTAASSDSADGAKIRSEVRSQDVNSKDPTPDVEILTNYGRVLPDKQRLIVSGLKELSSSVSFQIDDRFEAYLEKSIYPRLSEYGGLSFSTSVEIDQELTELLGRDLAELNRWIEYLSRRIESQPFFYADLDNFDGVDKSYLAERFNANLWRGLYLAAERLLKKSNFSAEDAQEVLRSVRTAVQNRAHSILEGLNQEDKGSPKRQAAMSLAAQLIFATGSYPHFFSDSQGRFSRFNSLISRAILKRELSRSRFDPQSQAIQFPIKFNQSLLLMLGVNVLSLAGLFFVNEIFMTFFLQSVFHFGLFLLTAAALLIAWNVSAYTYTSRQMTVLNGETAGGYLAKNLYELLGGIAVSLSADSAVGLHEAAHRENWLTGGVSLKPLERLLNRALDEAYAQYVEKAAVIEKLNNAQKKKFWSRARDKVVQVYTKNFYKQMVSDKYEISETEAKPLIAVAIDVLSEADGIGYGDKLPRFIAEFRLRPLSLPDFVSRFGRQGQQNDQAYQQYLSEQIDDVLRLRQERLDRVKDFQSRKARSEVRSAFSSDVQTRLKTGLIELIVNASQAAAGKLMVESEAVPKVKIELSVNDSGDVAITIRDNGRGFNPVQIREVAQYFFSEYPGDKGGAVTPWWSAVTRIANNEPLTDELLTDFLIQRPADVFFSSKQPDNTYEEGADYRPFSDEEGYFSTYYAAAILGQQFASGRSQGFVKDFIIKNFNGRILLSNDPKNGFITKIILSDEGPKVAHLSQHFDAIQKTIEAAISESRNSAIAVELVTAKSEVRSQDATDKPLIFEDAIYDEIIIKAQALRQSVDEFGYFPSRVLVAEGVSKQVVLDSLQRAIILSQIKGHATEIYKALRAAAEAYPKADKQNKFESDPKKLKRALGLFSAMVKRELNKIEPSARSEVRDVKSEDLPSNTNDVAKVQFVLFRLIATQQNLTLEELINLVDPRVTLGQIVSKLSLKNDQASQLLVAKIKDILDTLLTQSELYSDALNRSVAVIRDAEAVVDHFIAEQPGSTEALRDFVAENPQTYNIIYHILIARGSSLEDANRVMAELARSEVRSARLPDPTDPSLTDMFDLATAARENGLPYDIENASATPDSNSPSELRMQKTARGLQVILRGLSKLYSLQRDQSPILWAALNNYLVFLEDKDVSEDLEVVLDDQDDVPSEGLDDFQTRFDRLETLLQKGFGQEVLDDVRQLLQVWTDLRMNSGLTETWFEAASLEDDSIAAAPLGEVLLEELQGAIESAVEQLRIKRSGDSAKSEVRSQALRSSGQASTAPTLTLVTPEEAMAFFKRSLTSLKEPVPAAFYQDAQYFEAWVNAFTDDSFLVRRTALRIFKALHSRVSPDSKNQELMNRFWDAVRVLPNSQQQIIEETLINEFLVDQLLSMVGDQYVNTFMSVSLVFKNYRSLVLSRLNSLLRESQAEAEKRSLSKRQIIFTEILVWIVNILKLIPGIRAWLSRPGGISFRLWNKLNIASEASVIVRHSTDPFRTFSLMRSPKVWIPDESPEGRESSGKWLDVKNLIDSEVTFSEEGTFSEIFKYNRSRFYRHPVSLSADIDRKLTAFRESRGKKQILRVGVTGAAFGQEVYSVFETIDRIMKEKNISRNEVDFEVHVLSKPGNILDRMRENTFVYPGTVLPESLIPYFREAPGGGYVRDESVFSDRLFFHDVDLLALTKPDGALKIPSELHINKLDVLMMNEVLQYLVPKTGLTSPTAASFGNFILAVTDQQATISARTSGWIDPDIAREMTRIHKQRGVSRDGAVAKSEVRSQDVKSKDLTPGAASVRKESLADAYVKSEKNEKVLDSGRFSYFYRETYGRGKHRDRIPAVTVSSGETVYDVGERGHFIARGLSDKEALGTDEVITCVAAMLELTTLAGEKIYSAAHHRSTRMSSETTFQEDAKAFADELKISGPFLSAKIVSYHSLNQSGEDPDFEKNRLNAQAQLRAALSVSSPEIKIYEYQLTDEGIGRGGTALIATTKGVEILTHYRPARDDTSKKQSVNISWADVNQEVSARSEVRIVTATQADIEAALARPAETLGEFVVSGQLPQEMLRAIALEVEGVRREEGASVARIAEVIREKVQAYVDQFRAGADVFSPAAVDELVARLSKVIAVLFEARTEGGITLAVSLNSKDGADRLAAIVRALASLANAGALEQVLFTGDRQDRQAALNEARRQALAGVRVTAMPDLSRGLEAFLTSQLVLPGVHGFEDLGDVHDAVVALGLNADLKTVLSPADFALLQIAQTFVQLTVAVLLAQEVDTPSELVTPDSLKASLLEKMLGAETLKLETVQGLIQIDAKGRLDISQQGVANLLNVITNEMKARAEVRKAA